MCDFFCEECAELENQSIFFIYLFCSGVASLLMVLRGSIWVVGSLKQCGSHARKPFQPLHYSSICFCLLWLYLVVFRAFSWLCAHWSLFVGLRWPYGALVFESRSPMCKANTLHASHYTTALTSLIFSLGFLLMPDDNRPIYFFVFLWLIFLQQAQYLLYSEMGIFREPKKKKKLSPCLGQEWNWRAGEIILLVRYIPCMHSTLVLCLAPRVVPRSLPGISSVHRQSQE